MEMEILEEVNDGAAHSGLHPIMVTVAGPQEQDVVLSYWTIWDFTNALIRLLGLLYALYIEYLKGPMGPQGSPEDPPEPGRTL